MYAAAHARLPGHFAVKVLHRGLIRNLEAMTRFRQEAEITSTLRHPHIVQVLDFNVTPDGFPYLVMELLEGRPLATVLAERGAMEPAAAVRIVEQIAQAPVRRPRPGHRAPRLEARQRHAAQQRRDAGLREGARLRDLPGQLAAAPDRQHARRGHAPVHGARAGVRAARRDRSLDRPVLAGGDHVHAAHRARALQRRRSDRGPVSGRPQRPAAAQPVPAGRAGRGRRPSCAGWPRSRRIGSPTS